MNMSRPETVSQPAAAGVEQETGLERRVDQIVGNAATLKCRRVGRFMLLGPGHAE